MAWRNAYPSTRLLWTAQALTQKYPNATITGRAAAVLTGIPLLDCSRSFIFLKQNPQASPLPHISFLKTSPAILGRAETGTFSVASGEAYSFTFTSPADTVAHIALLDGREQAVVAADHCLRTGIFTESELQSVAEEYRRKRNVAELYATVSLMSGSSESVRETQLRLELIALNAGDFYAQPSIYLEDRGVIYRPDFLFIDQLVIVEYDGKEKYALDPHSAALADMERQHALTNAGFTVVRINDEMFRNGSWRGVVKSALENSKGRKLWGASICNDGVSFSPRELRRFLS